MGIQHHLDPQLGVHRVNRYIHRADVHIYYPLHLGVGEIGQRDIIAEKEREPRVVILEIEAVPQPLRELVDKTKDAFIFAAVLLIHEVCLKLKPDIVALILMDDDQLRAAVRVLQNKPQLAVVEIEAVVEHVVYLFAVDAYKLVARRYSLFVRDAVGSDPRYLN